MRHLVVVSATLLKDEKFSTYTCVISVVVLEGEEAFGSSLFLLLPLVALMFALSEIITLTTEPSQKLSNPHFHN